MANRRWENNGGQVSKWQKKWKVKPVEVVNHGVLAANFFILIALLEDYVHRPQTVWCFESLKWNSHETQADSLKNNIIFQFWAHRNTLLGNSGRHGRPIISCCCRWTNICVCTTVLNQNYSTNASELKCLRSYAKQAWLFSVFDLVSYFLYRPAKGLRSTSQF